MQQTTNQTILFNLLNAVILPGHQPTKLIRRRSELAQRNASLQRIATLPVPFRSPSDWLLLPGAGYDWVFMPITADPLYHDRRGFPMPRTLIKKLKQMKRQGIDFDQLWIAHEVQPGRLQPGQKLTVADLMPPPLPKHRPAWQGVALTVAGWCGLALLRGAFGVGRAMATMPTMPTWTSEPARVPAERAQPTVEPAKAPTRPTATVERPERPTAAPQPYREPVRPSAQRNEPTVSAPEPELKPTPVPRSQPAERLVDGVWRQNRPGDWDLVLPDGRVQSVPGSNVTVTLKDGSTYIRHDVSKKPTITPDGRIIYPDEYGFTYPETLRSCYLDPILFGVNIESGIADLYFLGAWAYGSR